jgi:hypothetical protein
MKERRNKDDAENMQFHHRQLSKQDHSDPTDIRAQICSMSL